MTPPIKILLNRPLLLMDQLTTKVLAMEENLISFRAENDKEHAYANAADGHNYADMLFIRQFCRKEKHHSAIFRDAPKFEALRKLIMYGWSAPKDHADAARFKDRIPSVIMRNLKQAIYTDIHSIRVKLGQDSKTIREEVAQIHRNIFYQSDWDAARQHLAETTTMLGEICSWFSDTNSPNALGASHVMQDVVNRMVLTMDTFENAAKQSAAP